MPAQVIKITGARQHNLKNLHLEIPREKLVVITGLSGSGKSSLAFDTLYAEGQRRYVESLSAYARQFLDQMEKPDVDFIEGLSPAVAIEQRSAGAKIIVLAPTIENQPGEFRDVVEKLKREGFVRARIDGELIELDRPQPIRLNKRERHTIEAVVDRLIVRDGIRVRLTDSIEIALKWGGNRIVALCQNPKTTNTQHPTANGECEEWAECRYSTEYGNTETGFNLGELTPRHFSFNSHLGACPACHGLGTQLVMDPGLLISDQAKTLSEGAITPWRRGTKRMRAYYRHLQDALTKHFHVNEDVPFANLPDAFKAA